MASYTSVNIVESGMELQPSNRPVIQFQLHALRIAINGAHITFHGTARID